MLILKEQETVDYLKRAKSCIHPQDQFANLPLLSHMLEIEAAYIERLMVRGPIEAACINIDATGFPELPSWLSDIKRAFADYDVMKAKRHVAKRPFVDALMQGSIEGIAKEGLVLSQSLGADSLFASVIQACNRDEINLLKTQTDFPFIVNQNTTRGLLYAKKVSKDEVEKVGGYEIRCPNTFGFKYVDVGSPIEGVSFIIFCGIDGSKIYSPRIMHIDKSLYRLSAKLSHAYSNILSINTEIPSILLPPQKIFSVDSFDAERSLQGLIPALFKAFISLELASLTDREKLLVFSSSMKFDQFIKHSTAFVNRLDDLVLSPVEGRDFSLRLSRELKAIYDTSLPPEAEAKFRLALAESIGNVYKPKEPVALAKPEEVKRGWLPRNLHTVGKYVKALPFLPRLI